MGNSFKVMHEKYKEVHKTEEQEQLEKTNKAKKKQEQTIKKDVVLFFSFDVVNSTSYKTINYYGWAQVINILFKELREEVIEKIANAELWRILGDEAIFVVKIKSEEVLQEYVNKIFKIMMSKIKQIKKGEFLSGNDKQNLKDTLSLKAAAWIAVVSDMGDISNNDNLPEVEDNIFETYYSDQGYKIFEFLGNDIDTGFRIAKYTQEGRLVLSYELAYLISQQTKNLSYLHIITYRKLKGVWKDRLYPIIWYHNSNINSVEEQLEDDFLFLENSFEDSFPFDACDNNELIKEYYDNRTNEKKERIIRDIKMYTDPYYAFNKILRDRELSEKVSRIQSLIKKPTGNWSGYMNPELMQIHCVAVCFKKDDDNIKILVAKRLESREKHKGQWEFGCAKAVIDKSIAEKIKEEYKQDFDIDVEPVLDQERDMKEPIPIALYHVNHSNYMGETEKQDKGIITLAEIIGEYNPENFQKTSKHEEVRWITENDLTNIGSLVGEKMVPDFEQTLRQAFEKIKLL